MPPLCSGFGDHLIAYSAPGLAAGYALGRGSLQAWHQQTTVALACGQAKNLVTLLDVCVSSLRRGHANLLCIVPILSDDLRGESDSSWWNPPPSMAGPANASGPQTHPRTVAGRGA